MKCRRLSESHNIVWFGKTGETPEYLWYRLNSGITGSVSAPSSNFVDIGGTIYTMAFDEGSQINGKLLLEIDNEFVQRGIFTLTTLDHSLPNPVQNYSEGTAGVADSLIQRLSVLKGELWYQVNFGIPLTDKLRSTTLFDMIICDIIIGQPDVSAIEFFESSIKNHQYIFNGTIRTVYGDSINLSNSYSI